MMKGCSSVEEFLEVRCAYLDELFESIRTNGYQTQSKLEGAMVDSNRVVNKYHRLLIDDNHRTHEVGVNIGRDGSMMLNSGYHRLTIAKILGLEEIPVQIIVRHYGWQRIRDQVATAETVSSVPEHVRKHLSHPDLVDVRDTSTLHPLEALASD